MIESLKNAGVLNKVKVIWWGTKQVILKPQQRVILDFYI